LTRRAVIAVSPHPDDELLGAPATLMAFRDAGWRVINLACSMGRPADAGRRHGELAVACREAGFELLIPDETPPIGRDDDLRLAQASLAGAIEGAVASSGARLLVGPSPHDGHHGHEVVGRAIVDAVELGAAPIDVMFWGLWSDLPVANVLVPFDADRLAEIRRALRSHVGELWRNRFDRLLEGRATANAVLGPERVFGYGSEGIGQPYAELVTHVRWAPQRQWRLAERRVLDPAAPLTPGEDFGGAEVGWWLRSESVASRLREGG
jgi:LmbE family N-acetylglucosaminyl deacetylase